jgi:dihydrofolate reductase
MSKQEFIIIAALDQNGLIGQKGDLPWKLPADLKHFYSLTLGSPVVMGRKTFFSLKKPLSNRRNIILSRDKNYQVSGGEVVHSLAEVLIKTRKEKQVFIAGGASLYKQFLPLVNKMYLTFIKAKLAGDSFFPSYRIEEWKELEREDYSADQNNPYPYSFVTLVRK